MDGKVIDGIFNNLLKSTGGLQDIETAIKTKDLAAIVRAASGALQKTLSFPMRIAERKSTEMSNQFRKEGNLHYVNKNYKEAILCYNKSLAYAPNNSQEVKLAYSNISAVLFNITAFRDCLLNIQAALESNCPEFLRVKLKKRKIEADKCAMVEMMTDMMISDPNMLSYSKFDVQRNEEIPCLSTDVSVVDGKVVAAKDIKSGTMVAMERAFVSVPEEYHEYTSCYYCHKMALFFIPCEGCCKALFCSEECRAECLEQFHRVECHIVALMGSMYVRDVNKMAVRTAITLSLKLGWEQLAVASLEMGEKRLSKSSPSEAYDRSNPLSILCYDDRVAVPTDVMVNASTICASAMHCLERVPGYLPKGEKKRKKASDALSRIMLHLNTTFLRKVNIICSAFDYHSYSYRCGVQYNAGWFSLTSKLPHSCEPNMLVLGFNAEIALVAMQRVKKGEPLTICFESQHLYDMIYPQCPKGTNLRQKSLYNLIQYKCECRVCLLEWHKATPVPGNLTARQNRAYLRCQDALTTNDFQYQMRAIGAALDEFTDERCVNTTQHYDLYGNLRRALNICQCAKHLNRSFECVSRYIFPIE